jgi:parvulin-like peptidyl-prolyl isomerase
MKYCILLTIIFLTFNSYGDEKKMATVNGKKINQEWIDHVVEKNKDRPRLINLFVTNVVTEEMLAQEAEKLSLHKDKDFKIIAEVAARKELADYFMRKKMAEFKITDDIIQQEYDKTIKSLGKNEYKLSQIVLESEEEAKKALSLLSKEKFVDVANKYKKNKSTPNGGSLGWVNESLVDKEILPQILKLKKGSFNKTAIKAKDRFFIVLLEDSREFKKPGLDQVKGRLVKKLRDDYRARVIKSIRDKSDIQFK